MPGNRQQELFPRSLRPTIDIAGNHRLVRLTHEIDWTDLQELVDSIRRSKLKSDAGRPPHLRSLTGALVLRATRRMTYRETEDQIRYYAPARFLCSLTETSWSPDANTIQDFEQLLGEDGIRRINEYVVKWAVREKLADPTLLVADTTAQEAAIPHPNEMGLVAAFVTTVLAASKRVGGALRGLGKRVLPLVAAAKRKLRGYRLFAKGKAKATKDRLVAGMASLGEKVQAALCQELGRAQAQGMRLRGYSKVAFAKLCNLRSTMSRLFPQIRYWLKRGRVAQNKIINLQIPELYAIVRGKVGKAVEFGLSWGIRRLAGGFLLATVAKQKQELHDSKYAVRAVREHMALFGQPPQSYGYDRGGWSRANMAELRKLGVRHVALAPRGRAKWCVEGKVRKTIFSQRAQVEAGIGTIKCRKYGFNMPAAKSATTMGMCGQRAVLGYNLNKLLRGLAERRGLLLAG